MNPLRIAPPNDTFMAVFRFARAWYPWHWVSRQTCKASTPWAQFHKINMKRLNPREKVLNVDNVGSLHKKWHYTCGALNRGEF